MRFGDGLQRLHPPAEQRKLAPAALDAGGRGADARAAAGDERVAPVQAEIAHLVPSFARALAQRLGGGKRAAAPKGNAYMKTRAAVAFEAKQPLEIVELDLEGPKAGEVLVEIMATGICHTDAYTLDGLTAKGCSPRSSATRARASCAKSGRASPA